MYAFQISLHKKSLSKLYGVVTEEMSIANIMKEDEEFSI